MAQKMLAKDSIAAPLAECYVTINGNRYNFMQAINLEANIEKTKTEVPILGQTGKGHKAVGWNGTGSATFHFNTSMFAKLLEEYKDTGKDIYFDIQVKINDPTSSAGSYTVFLKNCNLDGGILTKFDADSEYLDCDLDFTFDNFSVYEEFERLDGMFV